MAFRVLAVRKSTLGLDTCGAGERLRQYHFEQALVAFSAS